MLLRTLTALLCLAAGASAAIRAGAAKIDITPAPDAALPMSGYANRTTGFTGIHDPIFVRAIVVDDGTTQAAIVAWELISVPDAVWADLSQRIAAETGIKPENVIVAAAHNHGAPTPSADYAKKIQGAAIQAIQQAKSRLQPAKLGYGTGLASVNVNRRERGPDGIALGHNSDGASDKTVRVLRFDDAAGKPIALLINYAVHVVVMGPDNLQITGDLAGATSRFVERHYTGAARPRGDAGPRMRLAPDQQTGDVVAVWTSSAAGDQNPVSTAMAGEWFLVDALGKVLGEAAVRAAGSIQTTADARIAGAQKVVTCPGKTAPVNIRLSLLTLGSIPLAGVSGEVLSPIYQRLRQQTPSAIMITHANGASGYIPNDATFEQLGYEVTASRLQPGCAEDAIVNGIVGLTGRK
jgi:neutral ceramidase